MSILEFSFVEITYTSALDYLIGLWCIHSGRQLTYPLDALADSTIEPFHITPWGFTAGPDILHDLSVLVLCYMYFLHIGGAGRSPRSKPITAVGPVQGALNP